ncbi:MAG: SusC/RagA family TonB-linked outer membrane protein, partial [Cytophagales bacterium]|nr:SusC/RagA family TonB-linked outer membrane protein [Cytophagales bacterium]
MTYKYIFEGNKNSTALFLFAAFTLFLSPFVHAGSFQGYTVTGKVTSATDNGALPGVNVLLQGAQEGTITDINGNYSIDVENENSTLVFSYVGFNTEEISVGGRTVIDVSMVEDITSLEEIVVTALGIRREERSLGFAVGKVEGEEVTRVAQENVLNSLSGKISGATINQTGGTGSSVSMIIRGATSLNSDNQPLFIVDGIPMENSLNNMGQFGDRNIVDYGNAISDLNPDDIENVSILKGPSAAALYGTRAGNGVVLITTKRAKRGQRMQVNVSSNTVFDIPVKFLNVQKSFASGFFSFRPENVGGGALPPINDGDGTGAGPELDRGFFAQQWRAPLDANGQPVPTELVSYPDNVENFVNTGFTTTNGVSISNSADNVDYRIGFTNMAHNGVVPGSDLFRNNLSTSAAVHPHKNVTISSSINIGRTWSNNRPSSNRGTNPMQWAYSTPVNVDIRELKDYWVPGREGLEVVNVSPNHENPYFLAHEVENSFERTRIYGNIEAEWRITPEIKIKARYLHDQTDGRRETKIPPGYNREPNNGSYGLATSTTFERNTDLMATYNKVWNDFSLKVTGGGNALYAKNTAISNKAANKAGLIVPNVFTVGNISNTALQYNSSWSQRAIYSVFGFVNLGWRDLVYLDATARNDWSSTLPPENRSYFYPSASLSFLLNELVPLGSRVDMFKLRAGWAQVGLDTSPYNLYPVYGNSGQWGDAVRLNKSGTILIPDLKPEENTSMEFGLDVDLFDNRLRFKGTYYEMENRNQILQNIPLPVSSGYNNININAGLIESKGWEFDLGFTPVKSADWNWDLNFNFSKNETRIIELDEGVDVIEFWSDNKSYSLGYVKNDATGEDGLVGNIYSPLKKRVTDPTSPYYGYPLIAEGQEAEWVPTDRPEKVGNYNPDFLLGMQSRLSFKNFVLHMTFDWRSGGQYMSQTYRYFSESVQTQTWLNNLVNPNGLGLGQELEDWVIAHADELIFSEELRPVGGPTPDYGGFPETYSGTVVNDGTFSPGVVGYHDEEGKFHLVRKNLGGEETVIQPYVISFPW